MTASVGVLTVAAAVVGYVESAPLLADASVPGPAGLFAAVVAGFIGAVGVAFIGAGLFSADQTWVVDADGIAVTRRSRLSTRTTHIDADLARRAYVLTTTPTDSGQGRGYRLVVRDTAGRRHYLQAYGGQEGAERALEQIRTALGATTEQRPAVPDGPAAQE